MLRQPRTAHFPDLDGNICHADKALICSFFSSVSHKYRGYIKMRKAEPVMVLQAALEAKEYILLEYFSIEIDMYRKLVS